MDSETVIFPRPPQLLPVHPANLQTFSALEIMAYHTTVRIFPQIVPHTNCHEIVIRTQKYSTYAFSVFSLMHIANTSIIPLITRSVPQSESYLLLTRPYYQNRPFEPLLIGIPLVLHVGSGLALRLLRRQQAGRRYGTYSSRQDRRKLWPPLSLISASGLASMWLVGGHAVINRVVPLWTEGSSANVGLEYVAHGVAKHPIAATLGFTVLVGTAVWHMTWGWAKWLGLTPNQVVSSKLREGEHLQLVQKKRWYLVNGTALALSLLWLAGGVGVVGRHGEAEGWLAGVYDGVYRNIPILGNWY
jgi:Protein of unknown function (DUF1691)